MQIAVATLPPKGVGPCLVCGAPLKENAGYYCGIDCFRAHRRQCAPARFWSRVTKLEPHDCWLYDGSTRSAHHQYGLFFVNGRQMLAHRYSYELIRGMTIPMGLVVCHSCDVPMCVNPGHLFLGTQRDNVFDAIAKQRMTLVRRGSDCGTSILTPRQVLDIHGRLCVGQLAKDIAVAFAVSKSAIDHIRSGHTWGHLTGRTRGVRRAKLSRMQVPS